jgi:hypothetical protein
MRQTLFAITVAVLVPTTARTDEAGDLKDRVLKAAAKDPADIQKFKLYTLKAKGTSRVPGDDRPVPTGFELIAVYPGKLKVTWKVGEGALRHEVTRCASDDRGWQSGNSFPTSDLSTEDLNDFRTDMHGVFCSTLLALTEKETQVTLGERSKVGEDPVVSLKLSRRPYPEIMLYFDEKTHLLRKMAYRSRQAGVTKYREFVYDGHKLVGGLMLPTTQTTYVADKEAYKWDEMTFEFPDKLDGRTFDKR